MEGRTVPRIAKIIHETNIHKDLVDILPVIRPKWVKDSKAIAKIKSRVLSGGITNKLYAFWNESNPKDKIVVKIFGQNTDLMIDRDEEVRTMTLLNDHHCGPMLYAIFENGMCYEFIHGSTLTMETVRDPKVYTLIATALAREHKTVPIPGTYKFGDGSGMWRKMRLFYDLLESIFQENPTLKQKLEKECGFTLPKAFAAMLELEKILQKQKMPTAFCHNDLLLGNIMYNDETEKVTFIDFEYAFPNYMAFDVANHFNEFAGIDEPDFSRCPGPEFRRNWIGIYLRALQPERNYSLDEFERWVELCVPASHLFWSLWAAVQAHVSEIDYDYANYACLRFTQYEETMAVIHARKILTKMMS